MKTPEEILNKAHPWSAETGEYSSEWVVSYEDAIDAMKEYSSIVAERFAEWLQENRWFSFSDGKWNYTFEMGTAISRESYEKQFRKTTAELFERFLLNYKPNE